MVSQSPAARYVAVRLFAILAPNEPFAAAMDFSLSSLQGSFVVATYRSFFCALGLQLLVAAILRQLFLGE